MRKKNELRRKNREEVMGKVTIQSNRPANGIQSHIGTVAVLLSPDSAARIVSGVKSSIVAMLPQRASNFFIKSASKFYDI